jgi:hypothetical protein
MRYPSAIVSLVLPLALVTALVAWAGPVRGGDAGGDANRSDAKERFSRGLHLFENGDNGGALAEFKRAYELIPNRLVLYNIGLVYVSMGKAVEALETLEKVLSDPGPLKPEYLARARSAKEEQERRIGQLEVKVNVAAAIDVDGLRVGDAPLPAPLRVTAGEHIVAAVAPGYLPVRKAVTVAGLARAELGFELQPTEAHLAHIEVRCPLPGADILVDGTMVGKTPLATSVTVAPGNRVIELKRPGYQAIRHELTLSDGARGEVAFDPDEDAQAGQGERGRLRLVADEGDIHVTLDGRARGVYRQSIDMPAGPHMLKLERAGFETLERSTQVPSREEVVVKVALRPTPETRAAYVSHARSYRHWAYGALVSGIVVAGGSTGLALWSNGKLSDAESTLSQIQKESVFRGNGPCDRSYALTNAQIALCDRRMSDAKDDVSKYRNLRTTGIIGAAGGAALLGVGVTLLLLSPDPARYDRDDSVPLAPVLSAGPDGASLWIRGRF